PLCWNCILDQRFRKMFFAELFAGWVRLPGRLFPWFGAVGWFGGVVVEDAPVGEGPIFPRSTDSLPGFFVAIGRGPCFTSSSLGFATFTDRSREASSVAPVDRGVGG